MEYGRVWTEQDEWEYQGYDRMYYDPGFYDGYTPR